MLTDEQNGLFGCYYCRKGKHLKFNKVKTTNIENELLATKAELMRYARHLTRDEERARDLMQETVLKILVGRDKYECGTKFKCWARKIMYNSFMNNIIREDKMQAVSNYGDLHVEMMYSPGRSDIVSEADDIYNAVDHLPNDYNKLIRLLIMGHRYDEIAMMMDIPLGTVKSRIFVSRKMLKEKLKDYLE